MERLLGHKALSGLREASRRSVVQGGGPERFQYVTRVNQGQLSKYWTHDPMRKQQLVMPIDVAVEADMEAETPVIVGEMARLLGYRLVRDDSALKDAGEIEIGDIGQFQEAAHALSQTVLGAIADGHVDRREGLAILDRCMDMLRQTYAMASKAQGGED